ncbi:MAG TPA: APC family permease, partial [Fimbriimonadaceae bacterium]|nr:APC family permease [Fimbriimonadaceae bacterium]
TVGYLVPVLIALPFANGADAWKDQSWPSIAATIAGPALGVVVAIAALISQLGQLNSLVLASTRIPFALARERYLPTFLADVHPRTNAPYKTLWLSAAVVAALSFGGLTEILTLNVILFAAALVLEGISLVVLRAKDPEMPRPFRIPGGYPVVVLVAVLPVALSVILVVSQVQDKGWPKQLPTGIALASGPVLFVLAGWTRRRRASGG